MSHTRFTRLTSITGELRATRAVEVNLSSALSIGQTQVALSSVKANTRLYPPQLQV